MRVSTPIYFAAAKPKALEQPPASTPPEVSQPATPPSSTRSRMKLGALILGWVAGLASCVGVTQSQHSLTEANEKLKTLEAPFQGIQPKFFANTWQSNPNDRQSMMVALPNADALAVLLPELLKGTVPALSNAKGRGGEHDTELMALSLKESIENILRPDMHRTIDAVHQGAKSKTATALGQVLFNWAGSVSPTLFPTPALQKAVKQHGTELFAKMSQLREEQKEYGLYRNLSLGGLLASGVLVYLGKKKKPKAPGA